jgi:putative transposase
MPKLPKYLNKNGRYIWEIPNNTCFIKENGKLHFAIRKLQSYNWKTNATGRLIQVRFVPRPNHNVMETVYEIEVPDLPIDFKSVK